MEPSIESVDARRDLEQAMKALAPPSTYPALRVASVVFKVAAVVWLALSFYQTFIGHELREKTLFEKDAAIAFVAFLKEAVIAFVLFVAGDALKLGLDIKLALERPRS